MSGVSSIYNFSELSETPKRYDNSKKISQLRKKQGISYQDNTWIPVAQYNPLINTYYNLAINLKDVTSYCNDYSDELIDKLNNTISYELGEIDKLIDLGIGDLAYNINNSNIASTIISYGFTYNINYIDWQML